MNILITAPSLNPDHNVSGVSTVVQTIIQHNTQHHYSHYLLGRPDKKMNKLTWLLQSVNQFLNFPIFLVKSKIDLVHQNLPFDPKGLSREYLINQWCRLFKIPVLLHVHGGVFLMNGTNNPLYKRLAISLFKHCKKIVVLSEIEKEALDRHFHFKTAQILHNSIDVEYYRNNEKELPQFKPTILFLGRIHESKGIGDINEAFRLLKTKIDFRFILCGAGPMTNQFVLECKKMLGNNFEFRGVVSGKAKTDIIHQSHIFILPSRYGEGLPMALLETMAAGLVPVVTDDASMKFVVTHHSNGIRVQKSNPQDLYEKLYEIFSNPILYKSLSIQASKTIEEKFNINSYIIKLNDLYDVVKGS